MKNEFTTYNQALTLKELGFNEPCLAFWDGKNTDAFYFNNIRDASGDYVPFQKHDKLKWFGAPLYQQAINFLYICSNKQIDIELKGSDTYEERVRKINQGCEDLRNLQNNKSNQ